MNRLYVAKTVELDSLSCSYPEFTWDLATKAKLFCELRALNLRIKTLSNVCSCQIKQAYLIFSLTHCRLTKRWKQETSNTSELNLCVKVFYWYVNKYFACQTMSNVWVYHGRDKIFTFQVIGPFRMCTPQLIREKFTGYPEGLTQWRRK